MKRKAVGIDFETFYSADYSIAELGNYGYTHDPRFDAYMVTISTEGYEYKGPPAGADWHRLKGLLWLSHNKGFDSAVYYRLVELGIVPLIEFAEWHCTANLAVYVGLPRNLKGAVQQAFGKTISKNIRDKEIKGKRWSEMGEDLQKRVLEYALDDARYCVQLWEKYGDQWPETERVLSNLTYDMGDSGLHLNVEKLDQDIQLLDRVKFEAQRRIPWVTEDVGVLSRKAFFAECAKVGVKPPTSLAADDEDFDKWLDEHGPKFPWVSSIADYRRSNTIGGKFKTMRERVRPDGTMPYSLLYYGAHSGRWSGTGGVNLQNMPREPIRVTAGWDLTKSKDAPYSADMRSNIVAPEGYKLAIFDYAQIEARVTPWLCGDTETLDLARKGISVYEVHARTSMGWTGGVLKDEDKNLYQLAKARVLGLGFGCGWYRFVEFSKKTLPAEAFSVVFGADVTQEQVNLFWQHVIKYTRNRATLASLQREWDMKLSPEGRRSWINSWLQVSDFRAKNPKITAKWREFGDDLTAAMGDDYSVELPSGRVLHYFGVCQSEKGDTMAAFTRGEKPKFLHGALLLENAVQAIARDVMGEALIRLHRAGIKVVLHVHDEIVCLVKQDFDTRIIGELMTVNPSWARSLPLGVEGVESQIYLK